MNQTFLAFPVCLKPITQFYNTFLQKIIAICNRKNRKNNHIAIDATNLRENFSAFCSSNQHFEQQNTEQPSALCTKFHPNHVQKAEPINALCTKFHPNHVQKAEPIDALCTKFDLKHVQSREKTKQHRQTLTP